MVGKWSKMQNYFNYAHQTKTLAFPRKKKIWDTTEHQSNWEESNLRTTEFDIYDKTYLGLR